MESNPSKTGVEGGFELDLAGAWRLLGKMMVSQDAFFVFGGNQWELFSGKISAPAYLYLT